MAIVGAQNLKRWVRITFDDGGAPLILRASKVGQVIGYGSDFFVCKKTDGQYDFYDENGDCFNTLNALDIGEITDITDSGFWTKKGRLSYEYDSEGNLVSGTRLQQRRTIVRDQETPIVVINNQSDDEESAAQTVVYWIIGIIVVIVAVFTVPDRSDHITTIKKEYVEPFELGAGITGGFLGSIIAGTVADLFVDTLQYENYFLFSVGKLRGEIVSFGIFGCVFTFL